ncbi:MAG: hypothetical protein M1825_000679 [Sarcosagium campestre]|nr:MAG: hypothetical protein M1825_000679 [Sarcosagium campestre]
MILRGGPRPILPICFRQPLPHHDLPNINRTTHRPHARLSSSSSTSTRRKSILDEEITDPTPQQLKEINREIERRVDLIVRQSGRQRSKPYRPSVPLSSPAYETPATALTTAGLISSLSSRLYASTHRQPGQWISETDLAERVMRGEAVMFEDDDEKTRVLARAEALDSERKGVVIAHNEGLPKAADEESKSGGNDSNVLWREADEQDRNKVTSSLIGGQYTTRRSRKSNDNEKDDGNDDGKGVLGQVERALWSNPTYSVEQTSQILENLRRRVARPTPVSKGGATAAVKAAAAAAAAPAAVKKKR